MPINIVVLIKNIFQKRINNEIKKSPKKERAMAIYEDLRLTVNSVDVNATNFRAFLDKERERNRVMTVRIIRKFRALSVEPKCFYENSTNGKKSSNSQDNHLTKVMRSTRMTKTHLFLSQKDRNFQRII